MTKITEKWARTAPAGAELDRVDLSPMPPRNVAMIRDRSGLSQTEFADEIGTVQQTVSEWESIGCPSPQSFLLRQWSNGNAGDISQTPAPPSVAEGLVDHFGSTTATAQYLGVNPRTVRYWLKGGVPGGQGWGRFVLIISELIGAGLHDD